MTTQSTIHGKPHLLRPTQQQESNGDTPHSQPQGQPATTSPKPGTSRGEPEAPTDKPLPDLPNPAEVGEDG
jgi:hypothetical protein